MIQRMHRCMHHMHSFVRSEQIFLVCIQLPLKTRNAICTHSLHTINIKIYIRRGLRPREGHFKPVPYNYFRPCNHIVKVQKLYAIDIHCFRIDLMRKNAQN